MVEAALAVLFVVALLTAVPAGRVIARRREARRIVEHAERVAIMEGKIRALAEDIARSRGIPLSEAAAYVRAGMMDLMRGRR